MNIFDTEKSAFLRKKNEKSIWIIGISLAAAVLLCVLSLCLLDTLGRVPCQLLATAATALLGCICLLQAQEILHRKRIIRLCEKVPGPVFTARVTGAEPHTTTVGKLLFYELRMDVDGRSKTYFLYHEVDPDTFVGKTAAVTAADHLIVSLEVVP